MNAGRASASTRLALSLTVLFLASLTALSILLGRMVLTELEKIGTFGNVGPIASERLVWNLAQVQVEHMQLKESIYLVEQGGELEDLRFNFDVYYSRMATLRESPMFANLRSNEHIFNLLIRIQNRLDKMAPVIDGPDQALLNAQTEFETALEGNWRDVRALAQYGLLTESRNDAENKVHLSSTLQRLGWVLLALVIALGLTALIVWRLVHRGQVLSAANKASAARMRTMVRSSLDAILLIDMRGQILSFNGAAQDIFGYTSEEAVGQRMVDLIIPHHLRQFVIDNLASFVATGEGLIVGEGLLQLEGLRKSDSIFPMEISVSTSKTGNDEVFVAFLRDITDRVEGEAELRRARDDALAGERAKADLLTVMSHEIRTPLSGILGSIELLEGGKMQPEEKRYLQAMRDSGELLLHHVNEVLEMSRLDTGVTPERYRAFHLPEMVQRLVDSQQATAKSCNIELKLECRITDRPLVLGSVERIQQALLNLIANAMKFSEEGAVLVVVERLGNNDMIEFRVSDTGYGIAQEDLKRVFDDFVTLDSSYSRTREGTGLGLAITRRIIEKMGGEISVESELGEGSLFRFSLPLRAVSKHHKQQRDRVVDVVEPKRLLVVEDNDINRMLLEKMLQRQGHIVDCAAGGAEGVEAIRKSDYDLVFMDISMPDVDGIEALKTIRSQDLAKDTEIVALTAHAATDDRDRIMCAGFSEVVTKPVSQAKLAEMIGLYTSGIQVLAPADKNSDIQQFVAALGEERAQGYLDDFCNDVVRLQRSLDATERISAVQQSEAHRLAGSAAVLGLSELRSCMLEIESADQDEPVSLEALEQAWIDAGRILAPHLDRSRA